VKRTRAERARELENLRHEVFATPPMTVSAARKILARTKRLYEEQIAEHGEFVAFLATDPFGKAMRQTPSSPHVVRRYASTRRRLTPTS
jgi:hypothetical protein